MDTEAVQPSSKPAPKRISRRLFISATITALATTIGYIGFRSDPPLMPAALSGVPERGFRFIPRNLPDAAGEIATINNSKLAINAVSGRYTFTLADDSEILGLDGGPLELAEIPEGSNAAVWLDGEAKTVRKLQHLADLGKLSPWWGAPIQGWPTGQTRKIGNLNMITRAGWGASRPHHKAAAETGLFDAETNQGGWFPYPEPIADWLDTIVVHHSSGNLTDGPRQIQRFHQASKGYADLGYHYMIDTFGVLYEGRTITARGAHTGGANTGTIGVALIGNYDEMPILRRPLITMGRLIQTLMEDFTITHIAGHQDFEPEVTACPGLNVEPLLPNLAAEFGLRFGTEGYERPPWAK